MAPKGRPKDRDGRTHRLEYRLSHATWLRLVKLAKETERSAAWLVEHAVETYLERQERKP